MNCDWTERVSALIDGELTLDEATAVETHLKSCTACGLVRDDFLLLRGRISSYNPQPNLAEHRIALANILASKSSRERETSTLNLGHTPAQAGFFAGTLFGGRKLTPAFGSSLAIFLLIIALGLVVYVKSRSGAPLDVARDLRPSVSETPTPTVAQPVNPTPEIIPGGRNPKTNEREVRLTANKRKPGKVVRKETRRPRTEDAAVPDVAAGRRPPDNNDSRGAQPAVAIVTPVIPPPALLTDRAVARSGALDATRHAEQAQMLLRSFRNARVADDELAYERARSKTLLYRNIVLRREAASKRDPRTAQALDRLEPILLDIANLPENPAAADVDAIRERMRKQNIVVLLQASTAPKKRP